MRKFALIIFSFLMISCSELIDAPKNLIPQDTMSEVIAEFALNDQLITINPNTDMDNATRFTLKKHKITGTDFSESYKYYTATGDLENILDNAQEIILNKDPAATDFIENKMKQTNNPPPFTK